MNEYILVKCSTNEVFIGTFLEDTGLSIIIADPLKVTLFRESVSSRAKCYMSEWNELSSETLLELNRDHILYITTPDQTVINYYLSSLANFREEQVTDTSLELQKIVDAFNKTKH